MKKEPISTQETETCHAQPEDAATQGTVGLDETTRRLQAEIAAHLETEKALSQSEARYRNLVESLPDSVFVIQDDRVIYANPSAVHLAGMQKQDDLLGKSVLDLMHPDTQQLYLQRQQAALAQGETNPLIAYSVMRPDGSVVEVESVSFAFEYDGGPAFLIVVRDISHRKQAETEVLMSEARIRSILRAAPVGIGMLVNRVFMEVNAAMTRMTGYRAEELIGQTARMLYPTQSDFNYVGREKYQQIEAHGIGSVETRWRRKDGQIIDIHLSSSPIVVGDLAQGVTFTAQDITATKQAEQNRLAHEASLRDALVREIHHRIKNNLQGVIGLLRQHVADHPEMESPIKAAVAQINTISVVHGLQSRLPDQELRLCELLHQVSHAAGTLAMASHLPAIEDAMNSDVWLDNRSAVAIALILNELIHNALKHGRHASGAGVEIKLSGDTQHVMIQISNPGSGPLPKGFDLTTGKGCDTGLNLVRTLLPTRGAELNVYGDDTHVIAKFVLSPPVTSTHGHVARTIGQWSSQ